MTEALPKEQPKKDPQKDPKKLPKPRIERVAATSIIEAWKLFEPFLKESHTGYPDTSEETPSDIRHHLFQYLNQPHTVGLMAKFGKKPVGMILGDVRRRPFGKPASFCFIWVAYVAPEYRGKGLMKQLSAEFFDKLKRAGVFYWESMAEGQFCEKLTSSGKQEARKLQAHIGGKC